MKFYKENSSVYVQNRPRDLSTKSRANEMTRDLCLSWVSEEYAAYVAHTRQWIESPLVRGMVTRNNHDDVIKWELFPRNLALCEVIHRSQVDSPHKGQWRRALMLSLSCAWTNGSVKQSRRWRFQTPSRSLWRHCNDGDCRKSPKQEQTEK